MFVFQMLQLIHAAQEIEGGGKKKKNFVEKNDLLSRRKKIQEESNLSLQKLFLVLICQ